MPVTISKDFGKDLKSHNFSRYFPNSLLLLRRFAGFEIWFTRLGFFHFIQTAEWSGVEGEVAKVVELNVVKFVELKESSAVELEPTRLCLLPPHHIVPVVSQRLSTWSIFKMKHIFYQTPRSALSIGTKSEVKRPQRAPRQWKNIDDEGDAKEVAMLGKTTWLSEQGFSLALGLVRFPPPHWK